MADESSGDDHASFRRLIEARLAELASEAGLGAEARAVVVLDQQSVGRLSRMDALQGQAMAKATGARRQAHIARLLRALERIESGDFGLCEACGEPIAPARLRLDPSVTLCVDCAGGQG